jgi:selenocysteine-specific elongation factor
VLDALQSEGTLTTTEPGIIFTSEAVSTAKSIFKGIAFNHTSVTLAQFRDALATSRKYALSLLEHFDRINFTRKEGEGRLLKIQD